jgi:hypothetical protein
MPRAARQTRAVKNCREPDGDLREAEGMARLEEELGEVRRVINVPSMAGRSGVVPGLEVMVIVMAKVMVLRSGRPRCQSSNQRPA